MQEGQPGPISLPGRQGALDANDRMIVMAGDTAYLVDRVIDRRRTDPLDQGLGQIVEWLPPRPHRREPPAGPGRDHHAALQRRDQAGADQRRLAAPRRPDHRGESGPIEPLHEVVDLLIAAEEDHRLLGMERPQAGVRPLDLDQSDVHPLVHQAISRDEANVYRTPAAPRVGPR